MQNKPPPPTPFRAGAEGAWLCYLPGLEPGRWPCVPEVFEGQGAGGVGGCCEWGGTCSGGE